MTKFQVCVTYHTPGGSKAFLIYGPFGSRDEVEEFIFDQKEKSSDDQDSRTDYYIGEYEGDPLWKK